MNVLDSNVFGKETARVTVSLRECRSRLDLSQAEMAACSTRVRRVCTRRAEQQSTHLIAVQEVQTVPRRGNRQRSRLRVFFDGGRRWLWLRGFQFLMHGAIRARRARRRHRNVTKFSILVDVAPVTILARSSPVDSRRVLAHTVKGSQDESHCQRRLTSLPPVSAPNWAATPRDHDARIRRLRRRMHLTQTAFARQLGAANKAVIYQGESRKRCPSPCSGSESKLSWPACDPRHGGPMIGSSGFWAGSFINATAALSPFKALVSPASTPKMITTQTKFLTER